MREIISGLIIFVMVTFPSILPGQEADHIPRDTTYNIRSATRKIQRHYPDAAPVKVNQGSLNTEKSEMVYRVLDNRKLYMDIYKPARSHVEKSPCILCVHGGGWASGNKTLLEPLALELAKHGYVTATVEYRLSPEALYPSGVTDVKYAIRWLKLHADCYNLDTARIAILGTSAGATIATLVGNTPGHPLYHTSEEDLAGASDQVQAIINIDGILDFTDPAESGKDMDPAKPSAAARWLGRTYNENPELWVEASPLTYAGQHSPATLFINSSIPRFHAGRDEYISILDDSGTRSVVHTIPDSPHSFWLFHPWFDITIRHVQDFTDAVL